MALRVSLKSNNRKVGNAVITGRTAESCPKSCPFFDLEKDRPGSACYASFRLVGFARKYGNDETETLQLIADKAEHGATVRHHDVGDITAGGREIDNGYVEALAGLGASRPDLRHIMYTHAWRMSADVPKRLPWAVNASCETVEDVEQATEAGYMAVITVSSRDDVEALNASRPAGRRVVECPNQLDQRVQCVDCMLCSKADRTDNSGRTVLRPVVAFVAHGGGRSKTIAAIGRRNGKDGS